MHPNRVDSSEVLTIRIELTRIVCVLVDSTNRKSMSERLGRTDPTRIESSRIVYAVVDSTDQKSIWNRKDFEKKKKKIAQEEKGMWKSWTNRFDSTPIDSNRLFLLTLFDSTNEKSIWKRLRKKQRKKMNRVGR